MIPLLGCIALAGCNEVPVASIPAPEPLPEATYNAQDRACLARAMYFESNRSSEDGLRAVGTVVMNRVAAPQFPHTICGVVGQPKEFAAGVLSKPTKQDELEKVERIADEVLAGKRESAIGDAMYFHEAGRHFPYRNMRYVLVAGGNAFYEKRSRHQPEQSSFVIAGTVPTPIGQAAPTDQTALDAQQPVPLTETQPVENQP